MIQRHFWAGAALNHLRFVGERGARLSELCREPVSDRTSVLWQLVPAPPEGKP